jgi:hypothetical protein
VLRQAFVSTWVMVSIVESSSSWRSCLKNLVRAAFEEGHGVGKLRNKRFFSRYLDSKECKDRARCSSISKQLDGNEVMRRQYLVVSTSRRQTMEGKWRLAQNPKYFFNVDFNTIFNSKKVSIDKKLINKVYVKLNCASNFIIIIF